MPTTTAFRGGASVRALKEGDTSITITPILRKLN